MSRRSHSKVRHLPKELREAVDDALLRGVTYEEIVDWLKRRGHEVSRSSVGRYGKDFHKRIERLAQVREQTKAIVEEVAGRPATEMHEAANLLAVQQIFERLLDARDDIEEANIADLIRAVAQLERSAVKRERAKLAYKKAAETAAKKIGEIAEKENLSPEVLDRIKREVYGIVD